MRNYDKVIRFYDSWFDDLLEPHKQFTASDICKVIYAIREAQSTGDLNHICNLAPDILARLNVYTLVTQVQKLIDKSTRQARSGSIGGQRTAEQRAMAERIQAEERAQRDADRERSERNHISREEYLRIKAEEERLKES